MPSPKPGPRGPCGQQADDGQHDGPGDAVQEIGQVRGVIGEPLQRVRRRVDGEAIGLQPPDDGVPAGDVGPGPCSSTMAGLTEFRPAVPAGRRGSNNGGPAPPVNSRSVTVRIAVAWRGSQVVGLRRTLGVTRIPRGPVDETGVNPAGLTIRQVDAAVVRRRLHERSDRQLMVSVRTVNSHVAAVFGKLGAARRREVAVRVAELSVLDVQDR
jgi:DNA-binding CsgD family transcriptional regulator